MPICTAVLAAALMSGPAATPADPNPAAAASSPGKQLAALAMKHLEEPETFMSKALELLNAKGTKLGPNASTGNAPTGNPPAGNMPRDIFLNPEMTSKDSSTAPKSNAAPNSNTASNANAAPNSNAAPAKKLDKPSFLPDFIANEMAAEDDFEWPFKKSDQESKPGK